MARELVLYHYWRSSCSWRVRWALNIKQLSYKSVPVNILKAEHRASDYLKLNPAGTLPCLMVDGEPFGESMAIMEWLEDCYPERTPLLPTAPADRLQVRRLCLTIVAGTQPLQNPMALSYYSDDVETRQDAARHWITAGLGLYEKLLLNGQSGSFSFGSQVSMADLCLIPQVYNALRFGIDLATFPLVKGIYERCLATADCQKAAPENQPGAF